MLLPRSNERITPPATQFNPASRFLHDHQDRGLIKATAGLVAVCWARQLHDAGEPVPDLRNLTAQILCEARQ